MIKVCYDSASATISVNNEKKIGFLAWKNFDTAADYKLVLEKSLEIIEKEKIESWIPDNRDAKVVSPEDRKWTEENFLPKAISLGVKRVAFVFPADDTFKKYYASKLKDSQKNLVTFETFADLKDAEKWVLKQIE
jgi:hypothetical protein